jgi:hypothetical protein
MREKKDDDKKYTASNVKKEDWWENTDIRVEQATEEDIIETMESLWGNRKGKGDKDVKNEESNTKQFMASVVYSNSLSTKESSSQTQKEKNSDSIKEELYKNGSYIGDGQYSKEGKKKDISVQMIIENGIVKDFFIIPSTLEDEEQRIQEEFGEKIKPYIVGKKLEKISPFPFSKEESQVFLGFYRAIISVVSQAKQK